MQRSWVHGTSTAFTNIALDSFISWNQGHTRFFHAVMLRSTHGVKGGFTHHMILGFDGHGSFVQLCLMRRSS